MIDTIVIYINNLDKYPTIYEKFYSPVQGKNSVTTAMVDKETGEIIESNQMAVNIYHDTNRVLPLSHRSNINLPSSHYSLSYFVNTSRNRLEFNFSIPKYLFGTNILQFINLYDQNAYYTFSELQLFLYKFFKEQFIQEPLKEDVEINRIDLCYNQFFNSKDEALQYLDKQKELLVKYARSSKNNYRTYDTSLMYVTRRYSFKIYHKGEEFYKHDYKEMVRMGNPKDYDLMFLQQQADCILRYEMTFRNSFINYLMGHYFFHSKTAGDYHIYRTHPVSLFYRKLVAWGNDRSFTKGKKTVAEQFAARGKKFSMRSAFDHTNNPMVLKDQDAVTFDSIIFQILYNAFWDKVKQYQLETSIDYAGIVNRIKEYNKNNKLKNKLRTRDQNGLNFSRLLVPALLSQFVNLESLASLLPRTTMHRLRADLKKIGLTTKSVNITVVKPKIDYSDYKIFMQKYIHTWNG